MSEDQSPLDSTLDLRIGSDAAIQEPPKARQAGPVNLKQQASIPDPNPVDELAEEFSQRLRNGETPSVDEYVQRLPEQESVIRAMFQSIALVERIGKQERAERQFERQTNQLEISRKTLGDFRIVREIGRGGMGVVYEAIQESLSRRVALKVAGVDATQSTRQLQRFRREAEAAAKLHHTNIVPIYGTGEADGLSYYAMQLIDGISLSEVIQQLARRDKPSKGKKRREKDETRETADKDSGSDRSQSSDISSAFSKSSDSFEFPASLTIILSQPNDDALTPVTLQETNSAETPSMTDQSVTDRMAGNDKLKHSVSNHVATPENWFRSAARLTADVAHALHYAHQHKVLHRDIKPSNLMIDGDGTIWITDFGLARQEEHGSLTNTGDIVGTLRYMAPEQFNGHADLRSDICSLGLTFWEMLTLRPAFEEQRHGPLIKIKSEESPAAPRTVRTEIPKDLDTIANKACSLDPKHRYQTASEFAKDLERFLADRPIQARRASRPERLWRWARRNRAIASLSAASLLLLISLAVVLAMMNLRITAALQIAEAERSNARKSLSARTGALREVDIQREKAEESVRQAALNLQMAVEAFDKIMENVAARGLAESLVDGIPDSRLLSPEAIVTPADAELLNLLLPFFERFAAENNTDLTEESATALKRAGAIQRQLGRFDAADQAFAKAYGLYAKLADENPDEVSNIVQQARLLNEMALTASRQSKTKDATSLYEEARNLLEHPPLLKSSVVRFELARTLNLYTSMGARTGYNDLFDSALLDGTTIPGKGPLKKGGPFTPRDGKGLAAQHVENVAANERAREILGELLKDAPENIEYRLAFVRSLRDQSRLARQTRDAKLSYQALNDAINQLVQLTEDVPDSPVFRFELADTLCTSLPFTSNLEAKRVTKAVKICSELVEEWPNVPQYRALLGNAMARLAQSQAKNKQPQEARTFLEKALVVQRELVKEFPSVAVYAIAMAQSCEQLADLEKDRGNIETAQGLIAEAINTLEQWARNAENINAVQYLLDRLSTKQ
jgi:eukaryotic-like serine/threonine-protein kinase